LETFKYACRDESVFWVQNFVKMENEYSTAYSMFLGEKSHYKISIFLKIPMQLFPMGFGLIAILKMFR
jgi:hypothetical protein